MAIKTKSKRKTSKALTRSTRAQALVGRADHVRKGKKALAAKEALAAKNALTAKNALADQKALAEQIASVDEKAAAEAVAERSRPLAATARLTAAYMVLPMRLAACRSPFDLWREQARLAHQGLMLMQSVALGRH